jgi:hypothetical protein
MAIFLIRAISLFQEMKMSAVKGLPSLDSFSGTRALDFSSVKAPTLTEALRLPEISLPKFTAPALTAPAFTAPVIRAPEISTPAFNVAQATRNVPAVIESFESRSEAFQYANDLADGAPASQFVGIIRERSNREFGGTGKLEYQVFQPMDYEVDSNGVAITDSAVEILDDFMFGVNAMGIEAIIRGRDID